MCGIAGAVYWRSGRSDSPGEVAARMAQALRHRGPDGHGAMNCVQTDSADRDVTEAFGHTRLAILDLSERGAQPMASPRSPIWNTFNVEIYNFRAIRAELESAGRRFISESDSEVVLQGYEAWGDNVLSRLRGMFAFGIWDGARRRLLLARDRFGIKPIYIYQDADRLLFASEIRALLASGLVPRDLDR